MNAVLGFDPTFHISPDPCINLFVAVKDDALFKLQAERESADEDVANLEKYMAHVANDDYQRFDREELLSWLRGLQIEYETTRDTL